MDILAIAVAIVQYKLTCLWNIWEQRRTRAVSPTAISLRQMGQVLSWPTRMCDASTTTSGRVSIAASDAPYSKHTVVEHSRKRKD